MAMGFLVITEHDIGCSRFVTETTTAKDDFTWLKVRIHRTDKPIQLSQLDGYLTELGMLVSKVVGQDSGNGLA